MSGSRTKTRSNATSSIAVLLTMLLAGCAPSSVNVESAAVPDLPDAAEAGACPPGRGWELPLHEVFALDSFDWIKVARLTEEASSSGPSRTVPVILEEAEVLRASIARPSTADTRPTQTVAVLRETHAAAQRESDAGHQLIVSRGSGGIGDVIALREEGPVWLTACGFDRGTRPLAEAAARAGVDPTTLLYRSIATRGQAVSPPAEATTSTSWSSRPPESRQVDPDQMTESEKDSIDTIRVDVSLPATLANDNSRPVEPGAWPSLCVRSDAGWGDCYMLRAGTTTASLSAHVLKSGDKTVTLMVAERAAFDVPRRDIGSFDATPWVARGFVNVAIAGSRASPTLTVS
jgi:hypothetical protein